MAGLPDRPMPIRSGAMQRAGPVSSGMTVRHKNDDVGLPWSETIGSPVALVLITHRVQHANFGHGSPPVSNCSSDRGYSYDERGGHRWTVPPAHNFWAIRSGRFPASGLCGPGPVVRGGDTGQGS